MPHLLSLTDLGAQGLLKLLDQADQFKDERGASTNRPLAGKSIALVFEKASTRTRLSLEIAVTELGGHPVVLTSSGSQMGRGEPICDTARVLSRMVHAITFRTAGQERLLEMVQYSSVPVLNALTDESHPMQLLADLMTVRRAKGRLDGLKYAWVGDGNNMASSWIEAAGLLKAELVLACPAGYDPDANFIAKAKHLGANITVVRDPAIAVKNADVISTDVFTSMGQEQEQQQRLQAFAGMTLTKTLLSCANQGNVVLHCLPAHRGEEIDAELFESSPYIWDEAEARLHTSKAAFVWALGIHD
jgi:ornithine carbamoyltransferase